MEGSMPREREESCRHTRAPATRCIQIRDASGTRIRGTRSQQPGDCARRGDIGAPVSVADSLRVHIAARSTLRSPLMFRKWERMTIDGSRESSGRASENQYRVSASSTCAYVCVCIQPLIVPWWAAVTVARCSWASLAIYPAKMKRARGSTRYRFFLLSFLIIFSSKKLGFYREKCLRRFAWNRWNVMIMDNDKCIFTDKCLIECKTDGDIALSMKSWFTCLLFVYAIHIFAVQTGSHGVVWFAPLINGSNAD